MGCLWQDTRSCLAVLRSVLQCCSLRCTAASGLLCLSSTNTYPQPSPAQPSQPQPAPASQPQPASPSPSKPAN